MKTKKDFFDLLLDNWWLRHIIFWVCFEAYVIWGMLGRGASFDLAHVERLLAFLPGYIIIVYPLLYFLIPKYLIHKKFLQFIIGYCLLIGGIAVLYADYFELNFSPKGGIKGVQWNAWQNVLPFIHVTAIASMFKMLRYAFLQERRELSNKSLRNLAELELLKAQIHPHFLFNTLNNLFAHTLKKSPDSGKIVIKLSDLLRFMVYESREEKILLEKEINLLTDYIELEKLRYGKELDISVSFTGDIEGKKIRPLLLLPLIENSFKHGTSQQLDQKWISLHLHVTGYQLEFTLANSRDSESPKQYVPGKNKGIGIVNVQRRLELLYPGAHEFKIHSGIDRFSVHLKLNLDPALESDPVHIKHLQTNLYVRP